MQTYKEIDPNAAFPLAFAHRAKRNWARFAVALGALKGMPTVLFVNAVGQARYVTYIARTHMIPPWFAHVNATTGTPIHATAMMLMASAVIDFFSDLDVLANLLFISTLFNFMLVAVALFVRRYYVAGETTIRGSKIWQTSSHKGNTQVSSRLEICKPPLVFGLKTKNELGLSD
ncbi:hypothetical protein L7F22_038053 [Adiantum nelumboides]|nr:hypothetical protein [Adiantum nelumboides]